MPVLLKRQGATSGLNDLLPGELCELINKHAAALSLQRRWCAHAQELHTSSMKYMMKYITKGQRSSVAHAAVATTLMSVHVVDVPVQAAGCVVHGHLCVGKSSAAQNE